MEAALLEARVMEDAVVGGRHRACHSSNTHVDCSSQSTGSRSPSADAVEADKALTPLPRRRSLEACESPSPCGDTAAADLEQCSSDGAAAEDARRASDTAALALRDPAAGVSDAPPASTLLLEDILREVEVAWAQVNTLRVRPAVRCPSLP
jgi:hypothetical protein